MGRGERETRGEHRGRGERLPSGSRFVFPVAGVLTLLAGVLTLLAASAAPASAQEAKASGFTLGIRLGGVASTRLVADDIGRSILPDSVIRNRFLRDSVEVTTGISPAVTVVAGFGLDEDVELQVAAGYSFGNLSVEQSGASTDAGGIAIGHATVAVRKPVRGFLGRVGIGALWMHADETTVMREMRTINPLLEVGVARAWAFPAFDLEVGVTGQGVHLGSEAIRDRGGHPGMVYRAALELGLSRRFGR